MKKSTRIFLVLHNINIRNAFHFLSCWKRVGDPSNYWRFLPSSMSSVILQDRRANSNWKGRHSNWLSGLMWATPANASHIICSWISLLIHSDILHIQKSINLGNFWHWKIIFHQQPGQDRVDFSSCLYSSKEPVCIWMVKGTI